MTFIRPYISGLPLILLSLFCAYIIANKYIKYTIPLYESTSIVRLADIKEGLMSSTLYKNFDVFVNANQIGGEIEVIKSQVLINTALAKSRLNNSLFRVGKLMKTEMYNETPFFVETPVINEKHENATFKINVLNSNFFEFGSLVGQTKEYTFGQKFEYEGSFFTFKLNSKLLLEKPNYELIDNYELVIQNKNALIAQIQNRLDVTAIEKDIPVLRISYKDEVAQKAADFVNILAETYMEDFIEVRFKTANKTISFLDNQIDILGNKLSKSENDLENYRNENNIINITQETETDLRKISDLKVQKSNLQMSLKAIDSLNNQIKTNKIDILNQAPNFQAFNDLLSTELIKRIKQLQSDRKDLLLKYTENHELIKIVDQKIKDHSDYLIESINNSKINLQIKLVELNNEIAISEKVFVGLPNREKEIGILNRNFELNEQMYKFLQEKRTEAEIVSAATLSFHRLLTKGERADKPISPNATLIKAFSLFFALIISLFIIYLLDVTSSGIKDFESIERVSLIPLFASIPFFKSTTNASHYFSNFKYKLELKDILKENNILHFSSFNNFKHVNYILQNVNQSLKKKSVSIISFGIDSSITKKLQLETINYEDEISHLPENEIIYKLSQIKNGSDYTIIISDLAQNEGLALLAFKYSANNLIVFDSQSSKSIELEKLNELKVEFDLENTYSLLNRDGYSPIMFEKTIQNLINRLKRRFSSNETEILN